MIPEDAPQVQWYLRDFTQTGSAEDANIVVTIGKTESGAVAGNPDASAFWIRGMVDADFGKLTTVRALRYFLNAAYVERCRDSRARDSDTAKEPNP